MEESDKKINTLPKEDVIEEIMNKYGEEIKRLIFTYIKNWTQTEDLLQEVFLSVYLNLYQYRGDSSFKTWLYRIAVNKCKDYLKSWSYLHFRFTDTMAIFERNYNTASSHVEESILQRDFQEKMIRHVLKLPVKYREVIILHYTKELTIAEISDLLNIKPENVKTRLRRARNKLKLEYSSHERDENFG